MYERWYGYRYDRDRRVKDDAATMRADVKVLVRAGMLPADWTYSVRYRTASQMQAIDVTARSPRPLYRYTVSEREFETLRRGRPWQDTLTDEAQAVLRALTDLHNGYNHDGSDSQTDHFDVKFYGRAELDTLDGVPHCPSEAPV